MSELPMGFLKELGKISLGGASGFLLFLLTSHPKSPVHKKLPQKDVKNIAILPSIKLRKKGKTYHLHHWLLLTLLYISLLFLRRKRYKLLHGFLLGSILQGLTYKDRFRMVYRE